ncbi:lipopolysaccharide biosynthesis protein [Vibrio sp. ZSDE26]|uniref:Lipopolysaccharide biosynthesis protein n=1 Tax=Vibrio amylolyticus TaxID=2847292 RepID=A0A9X1XLD6_9VIBR|nr:lipopolysaccharide biosynthesis protein [Vibrio amylolyticus]MCK6264944.1 lipopolysaccharide biosynthesis protein [Vibrio amylolyticus]
MRLPKLPNSLKNMAIYATSIFLVKGMSLIMLPVMAQFLSPAQLGKMELLATVTVFFSLLVGLAMHENLYRFVGELKCKVEQFSKVSELYTYAAILSIIIGSVVTLFLFIAPQLHATFTNVDIALLCLVLGFESALGISMAWLRFQDRAMVFFAISIVSSAIQVAAVIYVLYTAPVVTYIYAVGVFTGVFQLFILHFINQFKWSWAGLSNLKQLLQYSIPLMLSTLVAFGLTGAEKWIIGSSFSIEELGIYSVAAKFSLAMCILVQPFGMWWMPKRFNALKYQGKPYTAQVTQCGVVFISTLAISVACASQLFISWTLPVEFSSAANLMAGVILVALFKELSDLMNIGILQHKKTQLMLAINASCTLGGLIFCWVSVTYSSMGIWGIIGSIALAQVSRAILLLYFSQRLVTLPFRYSALSLILMNTFCCLALSYFNQQAVWLVLITLFGAIFNLVVALRFKFLNGFGLPNLAHYFPSAIRGS